MLTDMYIDGTTGHTIKTEDKPIGKVTKITIYRGLKDPLVISLLEAV